MLDTIRLRLYGILDTKDDTLSVIQYENGLTNYVTPAHNDLYRAILKSRKKNFSVTTVLAKETRTKETMSEGDFIKMENESKLNAHYQTRQKMRFVEESQVKEINMRIHGSYRVRSSFSDVSFSINENGSFIDFEFSIPKYLYGHNLAEFIPQQGSDLKFHKGEKLNSFGFQTKYLFKRLNNLIDKFFLDLCKYFELEVMPDKNYIEVRRLDLCYNQYFKTRQDSLLYLNEQKKLHKQLNRESSKVQNEYDTSLAFVPTAGVYFKIYHKGSEYISRSGDLNKHIKLNQAFIDEKKMNSEDEKVYMKNKDLIWDCLEKKGSGKPIEISDKKKEKIKSTVSKIYSSVPYKVDFLKSEMDKVLRYEMTLRTPFFSSLYKRKVFRRNDIEHQKAFETYKKVKNNQDNRLNRDVHINQKDIDLKKMFHKWINRSVSLILSDNKSFRRFETVSGTDYSERLEKYKISTFEYAHTILANKDVGMFSDYFLSLCVDKFHKTILQYQIDKVEPFDNIMKKMKIYNEGVEERRDQYNYINEYRTKDYNGKQLIKSGRMIKKATQLLKDTELRQEELKKVNTTILATFLTQLEKGQSLHQIFKKLGTARSTKHRIKSDLKMFGVFERSLETEIDIDVRTDFFQYYWNTDGEFYRSKFYTNQNHFNNGQYKVA